MTSGDLVAFNNCELINKVNLIFYIILFAINTNIQKPHHASSMGRFSTSAFLTWKLSLEKLALKILN